MRLAIFLLSSLAILPLVGCYGASTPSPVIIPQAVYQRSSAEGSGVIGSIYIGPFPWTYPIRWKGNGTITLQYPTQPYVLLEGDFTWEPVYPEQLPAVEAERAAGRFAVVRKEP